MYRSDETMTWCRATLIAKRKMLTEWLNTGAQPTVAEATAYLGYQSPRSDTVRHQLYSVPRVYTYRCYTGHRYAFRFAVPRRGRRDSEYQVAHYPRRAEYPGWRFPGHQNKMAKCRALLQWADLPSCEIAEHVGCTPDLARLVKRKLREAA